MRRWLLGLLLLAVTGAAALALGAEALLNTQAMRDRVTAAAERATGHGVAFGRIELAWSAAPTLVVRDLRLLNPPGFTGGDFATARRIEARVPLSALLAGRVEVPEVAVRGASVRLQRDAAGRGNWLPPAAPAGPSGPLVAPRERRAATVGRIVLDDARVEWWGGPALEIPLLAVSPAGGPVEGRVVVRDVGFTLAGRTGDHVELTAVGGGMALVLSGVAGGDWSLQAKAADLAGLQALAARTLPAIRDVVAAASFGPNGLGSVRVTAASGEPVPGLRLTRLEATADGMDRPVRLTADALWRALPVAASLELPSLRSAMSGTGVPFQAQVTADAARLSVQGVAGPSGVDAAVTAELPDLARTGALAGLALPAARDVAASVQLLPPPTGSGVLLRGLRVTAAQGDVAGDLAVGFGPVPSLRGTLLAGRIDLDALNVAAPAPAPATPAPPAPAPGPAPGPAPPTPDARLIPASPVPFAILRAAEADLRLAAGQVTWRTAVWRAAEARLALHDGKLRVDPAQALAPGVPAPAQVTALITADAGAASAGVMLRGTGLDAGALSGGEVSGTLDVDVRLDATGADWRTLAATAAGHAGVALSEGEVENRLLATLFGPVLRAANVSLDMQGRSRVRCLAVRSDAAGGVARVAALGLDSTRLRLEGEGAVNLVDDTLDMHLRPTLRIGPATVAVPVRLTGPVRAPRPELERGVIAPGRVGISINAASGDPCPAALAAARAP